MRLSSYHREAFVRSVMNDVPQIDYAEQIRAVLIEDAVNSLPPLIQKAWRDPILKEYICDFYSYGHGRPSANLPGLQRHFVQTEANKKKLDDLVSLKAQQERQRSDLEAKVTAAINACSTRKQAVERMPEFEKYLPPAIGDTQSKYLPAIANLVSDLAAAGWPKDKPLAKGAAKAKTNPVVIQLGVAA